MPIEDEIRGLKRELASSSCTPQQRTLIAAQLSARGAKVETRTADKPTPRKKATPAAKDE